MSWWEELADDALEDGVKGGLRWAWRKIGPRKEIEAMTVTNNYIVKTGLLKKAQDEGLQLRWTSARLIEERLADGWEYVYEPDEGRNVKRKLVLWDGSILLKRDG